MKITEYAATLIGAAAIGCAIGLSVPVSTAWPGEYLFPTSPFKKGHQISVVQWCDRPEDLQSVVDTHAKAGREAASAAYEKLVESELCHWLPGTMPTTGILIEEVGFAYVMEPTPVQEEPIRIIVEVWAIAMEGIEGREVFITMAYWSPEFTEGNI